MDHIGRIAEMNATRASEGADRSPLETFQVAHWMGMAAARELAGCALFVGLIAALIWIGLAL